jgi:hypothetical protein
MKNFTFSTIILLLHFSACTTGNQLQKRDNAFGNAFAALEKDNTNASLRVKAQEACSATQQKQLAIITALANSNTESQRDDRVNAYTVLQKMYETITSSPNCSGLLTATNYQEPLAAAREEAAAYYYQKAETLAADTLAGNIRQAVAAFEKVLTFVPGYRDAAERMQLIYSSNSFVVAFNPLEDSAFFAETVASSKFYTYSNEVFINNLIRDLNTEKSNIPFLVLLPYSECLKKNIAPDWLVDITIPRLNIPVTNTMKTSYTYEKEVAGTDSTGRPIYRYVSVPYYYNCDVIDNGQLELNVDITDAGNGQTIKTQKFDAQIGSANLSKCDGNNISAIQSGNLSLRENAASVLYANLYPNYKKSMKDLFEK